MHTVKQCSQLLMRTCSLCNKFSEAEGISLIYFGEWMTKKDITVHYYCLLLSTHLPQRGEDHSGILGFLLRDIRLEIIKAKKRKCMYCSDICATIQCTTCKEYFHLTCGHTSKSLSQFVGEFKSYCHACVPVDQYQVDLFARKPPQKTELCFICAQMMGTNPKRWIYAKCCDNGFTHSKCMKIYALSAGYYLTCIWCKDKRFREDVKYVGVFVPDREANWEKEKGAYCELYQRHKRCDMESCNCPKGRDYYNAFKWQLIICKLCGAFGAHNPACIPGFEDSREKLHEYKCDICSVTEQTVHHKKVIAQSQDLINTSLYVSKDATNETLPTTNHTQNLIAFDSITSQEIVTNGSREPITTVTNSSKRESIPETIQMASPIFTLTQSPHKSQQMIITESLVSEIEQKENSDCEDVTADFLVQKLLDIFEVRAK